MSEKDYDLNLKQFSKHEKVFPWRLILKLILGLALVAATYYLTVEISKRSIKQDKKLEGIEVEIEEP